MTTSQGPVKGDTVESVNAESIHAADAVFQLEARELKSRFNIWAAIGIQFSISATPLAVGVYITLVLGAGGSPYFFYAFLVAALGQMLICICMAEIASVFPHASGMFDETNMSSEFIADVSKVKCSGLRQWRLPSTPNF